MDNLLTRLLGTRFPIIQAPMAGSSGVRLAIAAARAGALGSLPCAMRSPSQVREDCAAFRAATNEPLHLNFFAHRQPDEDKGKEAAWAATLKPYFDEIGVEFPPKPGAGRNPFSNEYAGVVEDVRPEIVSFHFGLPPADLLARVKRTGAKVLSSATTAGEAAVLAANGCDAIIAQGSEAGGHRGLFLNSDTSTQLGVFALIPLVAATITLPIIAAGGIMDRRGVRAALALGADGVLAGTAFLLCPECDTNPIHRAAITGGGETALTNIFTGRPARGVVNRAIRELGALRQDAPQFPRAAAAIAPLRAVREAAGSADFSPLWAGQGFPLAEAVPASSVVAELALGFGT